MKREIKFRAWCENSGEFIMIDEYLFIGKENNHAMGADFTNDYPCVTKVIDVMQYTGLKDKNGKEIYEGDVLQFTERPKYLLKTGKMLVCWNENYGCYGYKYEHSVNKEHIIPFVTHDELKEDVLNHCEVIGNIYQNPELLTLN